MGDPTRKHYWYHMRHMFWSAPNVCWPHHTVHLVAWRGTSREVSSDQRIRVIFIPICFAHLSTYIYIHIYIYRCMYKCTLYNVCIYIYICIYIYMYNSITWMNMIVAKSSSLTGRRHWNHHKSWRAQSTSTVCRMHTNVSRSSLETVRQNPFDFSSLSQKGL